MITSLLWKKHWQHKWFINWGKKEQALPQAGASVDINNMVIWAGLVNSLAKFQLLSAKEAKGHEMINCYWLMQLLLVIAELAKHSPIIIQNSSNPSSQKKIWMYNHMTVRLYKVLLLTCAVNCTAGMPRALFSSPMVSALGSKSDNPGSSPGQSKALCPWDMWEKKVRAPLLGLAKSIYLEGEGLAPLDLPLKCLLR